MGTELHPKDSYYRHNTICEELHYTTKCVSEEQCNWYQLLYRITNKDFPLAQYNLPGI